MGLISSKSVKREGIEEEIKKEIKKKHKAVKEKEIIKKDGDTDIQK